MKKVLFGILAIAAGLLICRSAAFAVTANPLQSAYWRFEEGPNGSPVTPGIEFVQDSINDNDMRASTPATAPTYTNTVAPFALRSGAANNLSLDFATNTGGGGDDLFTAERQIDNGIITTGGGFTLEAAFKPDLVGGPFQAIVAKNGLPPASGGLPTLVLKVRGDNGNLQVEQFDKAGAQKSVQSSSPLTAGEWYAAAAVNDGTNLSLYLRRQSDIDYVLQGTIPVSGALYQGTADDWDMPWSIGRAIFGGSGDGNPADWFDGLIDEARLTNRALTPTEFLFAPVPEPASLAIVGLAFGGFAARFRGRRQK